MKNLVSAIIPARNEESSVARAVESVAAQAEVSEIIVVDDESTDATSAILAGLASRIPKLKILRTGGLPPGWVGKSYAVSLGAAAASGEWLLFTDADTYHYLGSTRRALTDAVDHDAVMVSYSPEQELGSFWERALIPMVYCRLAEKFSFSRVNDPSLPDAAANGQFLMILRDVYQRIGGHAAVSGEILEDVALARRVKLAGYRIYFTAPIGIVRTRMYRTFRDLWQGWTKNLYALLGGTGGRALLEVLSSAPWLEGTALILAPFLAFAAARRGAFHWVTESRYLFLYALAFLAGRHFRYGVSLYRNLYPVRYIEYYVPGVALYAAAVVASWWKSTRGAVVWKGREYPAGTS
ncbi:MAG TPA: glycosyltransferase family 2 protein [Verrucomicrobiae bacterium]|nr:glycosyltransferase family 2 protein [Verrucomicrobiae bacterium]